MNLFFLSLAIIFCGGLLPLIFRRQFTLMKISGILAIGGGCLLGLIDAGTKLFNPGPYAASFDYQNAFSLSFQIDALSAFFHVAIYLICLLAALTATTTWTTPKRRFARPVITFFSVC